MAEVGEPTVGQFCEYLKEQDRWVPIGGNMVARYGMTINVSDDGKAWSVEHESDWAKEQRGDMGG